MKSNLKPEDIETFSVMAEGYSMADLVSLVKEVAMTPVREIPTEKLMEIKDMDEIRGIEMRDIESAMKVVVPSVSKHTILEFENWRKEKGQV